MRSVKHEQMRFKDELNKTKEMMFCIRFTYLISRRFFDARNVFRPRIFRMKAILSKIVIKQER